MAELPNKTLVDLKLSLHTKELYKIYVVLLSEQPSVGKWLYILFIFLLIVLFYFLPWMWMSSDSLIIFSVMKSPAITIWFKLIRISKIYQTHFPLKSILFIFIIIFIFLVICASFFLDFCFTVFILFHLHWGYFFMYVMSFKIVKTQKYTQTKVQIQSNKNIQES